MILLANKLFGLNLDYYKAKIALYLKYIANNFYEYKKSDLTYGALNSLVLGHILKLIDAKEKVENRIYYIMKEIPQVRDNQDALLLIALSFYLREISPQNKKVFNYLLQIVKHLIGTQRRDGSFQTGDIRAVYHQRMLYVSWGLALVSPLFLKEEIKKVVEITIQYIWDHRRDKKDDGFLWHPKFYFVKNIHNIPLPIASIKSSRYLFECHQSFFVNAINFYQYFFNNRLFEDYKSRALDWIFGANRLNLNLVEINHIGLPIRLMDNNGNIFIKNQMFKGSYEVGNFICALAGFLK
jgi:hypothetical protein